MFEEKRNIFFIQEHLEKKIFHGGIGNVDIEKILMQHNFKPLLFPYHYDFSIRAKLSRFYFLVKTILNLKPASLIVIQFPLYARMNKLLVQLLPLLKRAKIIYIIADIDGLKDDDHSLLQKEIRSFKKVRYFIVHNNNMRQWFLSTVPEGKFSLLYFFDFMAPYCFKPRSKTNIIAFAGNLSKSLFLEQLHQINSEPLQFNLYGPGFTALMNDQKNISYKGQFEPYTLPQLLQGSFGLVWDGNSIDGEGGSIGNYMRYITHHKVSLYILAGLPIIIYEKAGAAELIKQYNIGFTISNLFEIEQKIKLLTDNDYQQMILNMRGLAEKISTGKFLENALNEIIRQIVD